MIKPFVDARTLAKIVFVDIDVAHRELVRPELLRIFDSLEQLEESLARVLPCLPWGGPAG